MELQSRLGMIWQGGNSHIRRHSLWTDKKATKSERYENMAFGLAFGDTRICQEDPAACNNA
jgi:hypothetical protein